ncbi:hypothetical protein P5W99_00850 [Paraburkholderia sp. A3BS-1L]|uniref:hypothetical protein n=1 Tax=Paraburkholderia sp. A3BS-1L TaxID=3028375 RepID=UPI003DAA4D71
MHDPRPYPEPFEQDDRYLDEHDDDASKQPFLIPPSDNTVPITGTMPTCPKCHSSRVDARNLARKTGSAIGTVAGTTSGIAIALSGAETGAAVGLLAGPAGAVCGAIAGAVIAGLLGGAAGCATGSVFGEIVDDKVLDNFRCHACGHTFSRPKAPT